MPLAIRSKEAAPLCLIYVVVGREGAMLIKQGYLHDSESIPHGRLGPRHSAGFLAS